MELLKTNEKLLLEEALDALRMQSSAWLKQLDLWKDEKLIYQDMVSNRLFQSSLQEQKSLAVLFEQVMGIELDALYKDILSHDKFLLSAIQASNGEDRRYREIHRQLQVRYDKLGEHARSLRKAILTVMKLVNENFFNRNETLATIAARRAVRKYKTTPVDRLLIEQVINAACMAPSALNGQPWKFYVVSDKEKIKKYDAETYQVVDKLYHELMSHMGKENAIFHGAPVIIFITGPKSNEWAPIDIGLCAQNLMLAARSVGLDTCPVGLGRFIEGTPAYKDLLIPAGEQILLAITLGYADEHPEMHERKRNNVIFLSN